VLRALWPTASRPLAAASRPACAIVPASDDSSCQAMPAHPPLFACFLSGERGGGGGISNVSECTPASEACSSTGTLRFFALFIPMLPRRYLPMLSAASNTQRESVQAHVYRAGPSQSCTTDVHFVHSGILDLLDVFPYLRRYQNHPRTSLCGHCYFLDPHLPN
jgi:hypothetical protein